MKARLSTFLQSMAALLINPRGNPGSATPLNPPAAQAAEPGVGYVVKPRAPTFQPQAIAAYWRGGLDYVDFRAYGLSATDAGAVAYSHLLALDAVAERGTLEQPGEEPGASSDVEVVLLLCQLNPRDQRPRHGHPLLAVPARLLDEQFLAPRTSAAPVLNPAYLAPNQTRHGFALAEGELANEQMFGALSALSTDKTLQLDWATWWSAALGVVRELLAADSDDALCAALAALANDITPVKRGSQAAPWVLRAAVFPAKSGGSKGMLEVYSSFLNARQTPDLPLLKRFCAGEHAQLAAAMAPALAGLITGHIDEYDAGSGKRPLFPLDESQRRAACAVASLAEGEVQAINGPPGSGKTSMLRAVVASRWVSAALNGEPCPIIVACGATNQSVTNVIGAFGNAPHPDAALPYAQRWVHDVPSYGAYFPSQSVLADKGKQAELAKLICVQADRTASGMLWSYRDRPPVLTPNQALGFEELYLGHARQVLPGRPLIQLEDAVEAVLAQLRATVTRRDGFLLALASAGGAWRALLAVELERLAPVWPSDRVEMFATLVSTLENNPGDTEAARGVIDLTFSSDAFHWAARYWEGRFLLAQRERLFSRHPSNVEESLRRLCMLTPCLVSTLHNVCALGRMQPGHDADPAIQHTLGLFDLLVIDEAGQAAPELAGPALLMARRAVAVGDLKQLAPIWNHNHLSELAVAAAAGIPEQVNALRQACVSVADGSVLAAARLVSKWREEHDLGISLRYHYRCKPSIIGYCNALSYNNTLVARTREGEPRHEPAMAWVAIETAPTRKGGSLCNLLEAEHITQWVGERWPAWQADAATRGKPLHAIVALITAYRPQANLLRAELEKVFDALRGTRGIDWPSVQDIEKVTVGTVHQLQGAERPIVCFSLVEGPDDAGGSFMDRDPSMLNVAVSRAKSAFIVFGHPERLFPAAQADPSASSLAPVHFLGAYLRNTPQARLLYPRCLVVIEAGGKQRTLAQLLGKQYVVVATQGALQRLPLPGGVDVPGGLVPLPRSEDGAEGFLQQAGKVLDAVEDVIIATDDDRMGELIAWQVQRLLQPLAAATPMLRVRLGAINGPAVRAAFAQPGALDERKVLAEAAREVVDLLITQRLFRDDMRNQAVDMAELQGLLACGACAPDDGQTPRYRPVGRVQAAILRLLLDQARAIARLRDQSRVRVVATVGQQVLRGYLFDIDEQRDQTQTQQVDSIVRKLQATRLELVGMPQVVKEQAWVPAAGTFSLLAEAWRRFGHLPWDSLAALQALYDGSWSSRADDQAFEPEAPIIPDPTRSGHPPVTPLDRAAPPSVLAGAFKNALCEDLYTLVWERFEFAERLGSAGLAMARLRVDYRFAGQPRLGVRFEGVNYAGLTAEQAYLLEQALPDNDAVQLQYHFADIPGAALSFEGEAAGRWTLPMDQLLLNMEQLDIGRPSTCASALEKLFEKGLLEPPIHRGQLRLTPAGVRTALALESGEQSLSSPQFCSQLSALLQQVESGQCSVAEALEGLAPVLSPHGVSEQPLWGACWSSLQALQAAQGQGLSVLPGGGVISAPGQAVRP